MRTINLVFIAIFLISFASSACPSNMVTYFKFDGNLNNQMSSSGVSFFGNPSTSGNDAVFVTSPTPTNPSGINDNPTSRKLNFYTGSSPFTILFWFTDDSTSFSNGPVIMGGGYSIYLDGSGNMVFKVGTSQVSASYTLNSKNHYALVYNYPNNKMEIFKDGSLVQSSTTVALSQTPSSIPVMGPYDSTIDELAFFNSALTSVNIGDYYSLSNNGDSYCDTSSDSFSSVGSSFILPGCKGVGPLGNEISVEKGSCSRDGFYYCGNDEVLRDTLNYPTACSLGALSYEPGQEMCCPSKYICDPATLTCDFPENVVCSSYTVEDSCSDAGCYWIQDQVSGKCITSPSEYGCSIYTSPSSCIQDTYNVGSNGFGTEVCSPDTGIFSVADGEFIVPTSSCGCVWDNADSRCKLSWTFTEALRSVDGNYNEYECVTDFTFGICFDGRQEISWETEILNNIGPIFSDINYLTSDLDAISAPGCIGGKIDRDCGEPIVNLPGFGLTSIILSVLILGIYYYRRRNDL